MWTMIIKKKKDSSRRIRETAVAWKQSINDLFMILKWLKQLCYLVLCSHHPIGLRSSVHSPPVASQVSGWSANIAQHLGNSEDNDCNRAGNDYVLINAPSSQGAHANGLRRDGKVKYIFFGGWGGPNFPSLFPFSYIVREFFSI